MQDSNEAKRSAENTDSTQSNQRSAGDEALEGNTGVGGSVDQGGDSDGNTGVMSNDVLENELEPGSRSAHLAQQPAVDKSLERNTGAGEGNTDQGGDSDGNTGVMSNDEWENKQQPDDSSLPSQDSSGSKGG